MKQLKNLLTGLLVFITGVSAAQGTWSNVTGNTQKNSVTGNYRWNFGTIGIFDPWAIFLNLNTGGKIFGDIKLVGQINKNGLKMRIEPNNVVGNNASTYLLLPDSLNQGVHPDIYYNPAGWNGYKYWMVYEPYTNGDINLENPYLVVSNDGVAFSQPAGITNPVFPLVPGTHNSDGDIYEGLDGKLWMTNRRNSITADTLVVKSSLNGTTWSGETVIATGGFASLLSPTTILENGVYRMWYVDNTTSPATFKYRTSSTPNGSYSAATTCSFTGGIPSGYSLWHGDVLKNGEQYILLMAMNNNSLGSLYNTRLFVATSDDGQTWAMNPNFILGPKAGSWDNAKIYRSSAFIIDKGDVRKLGMYYSAYDSLHAVHVGYTEVSLGNNNIQNQNYYTQPGDYKISGHASSADVKVIGTGGNGFFEVPTQSASPGAPPSGVRYSAGSAPNVARIVGANGFSINFNFNNFTNSHTIFWPDLSNITVATTNGPLTSYAPGVGTVTPTDNIISALQKIDGNEKRDSAYIAANTTNITANTANIATNTSNITALQNSTLKIVASYKNSAKTDVGTLLSYAVPADGVYRINANMFVSAISTNTIRLKYTYTEVGGQAQTITGATVTTAAGSTVNNSAAFTPLPLYLKAGTTFQLVTENVATGGSQTYSIVAYLEN